MSSIIFMCMYVCCFFFLFWPLHFSCHASFASYKNHTNLCLEIFGYVRTTTTMSSLFAQKIGPWGLHICWYLHSTPELVMAPFCISLPCGPPPKICPRTRPPRFHHRNSEPTRWGPKSWLVRGSTSERTPLALFHLFSRSPIVMKRVVSRCD